MSSERHRPSAPAVRIKKRVKGLLQGLLPTLHPPLVVASMGRSGSTVVWDALRHAMAQDRFPAPLRGTGVRLVTDGAWDLAQTPLARGVVYKTHALAHEMPRNTGARVIFLYGSATDAALSVLSCRDRYGANWVDLHFKHLRADGPFSDLGRRDVLRFADQLDGWCGLDGVPRLLMHYDALWDHQDLLRDFTGLPVTLPPRRMRQGAGGIDADTRARFAATYADLDARIATLPRAEVRS